MLLETRRVEIVNPAVTDRALRYRANRDGVRPEGPRICAVDGRSRCVDVDHVNGHEEDSDPRNLIYLCRSCNTRKGLHFRNSGVGRLTHQYNPAKAAAGARSLGQWLTALMTLKGESDAMTLSDAIAMVHATPAAKRSEFAHDIWRKRREHGEVPF